MPLSEAKLRLDRAKEAYRSAVANVDRMLKPIVAANPSVLEEARALQRSFTAISYTPLVLTDPHAPGEAPPADDAPGPA